MRSRRAGGSPAGPVAASWAGPASLWAGTAGPAPVPRARLRGVQKADVCIVGAGFTGLWTAYHLSRQDPSRRIVIVEREIAGFGASGRNGGWCSALFPVRSMAEAMRPALTATIDGIAAVCADEGIDCDFVKAGYLELATTPAQQARMLGRPGLEPAPAFGRPNPHQTSPHQTSLDQTSLDQTGPHRTGPLQTGLNRTSLSQTDAIRTGPDAGPASPTGWLSADEVARLVRVPGALGGVLDPECAALHPLKLVRGLTGAVLRGGVELFERSRVRRIEPGRVTLDSGTVRADVIVRATEGYTATLPGLRRELAPVYSLVIATEPLSAAAWESIGWERRVTLSDARRLLIYAQRTADGRIVLGGRGAPYHFASRTRPDFDGSAGVFEHLRRTLATLFPAAADARITHHWGGPLGVPRDWTPGVAFDPATGLARAGGYVGDGVAASALAGRTLADLIRGRDTELTRLPWVTPVTTTQRRWEPEPARWLGINGGRVLAAAADTRENRTGRPTRLGGAVDRLTGH